LNHNKEHDRIEDEILDKYLLFHSEFIGQQVIKNETPDYLVILHARRIGIEITALKTSEDAILSKISREAFGKHLSAGQVKEIALKRHHENAEVYEYFDVAGTAAIGSPILDINARREVFTAKVCKKLCMYRERADIDTVTVLCDARPIVDFTSPYDSELLMELVKDRLPFVQASCNMTVAVLYIDNEKQQLACFEWQAVCKSDDA